MNQILTCKSVTFDNDVGGTSTLEGEFKVKVIKSWDDYETGKRMWGNLIDPKDIETVENKRKTNYEPKKPYNQKLVYISEFDILKK